MKKLLPLLLIPFATSALADELPERNADGYFENINNKKEYRYEIYPELAFWYEGGRPFWREVDKRNTKRSRTMAEERTALSSSMIDKEFDMEQERITFAMEEKDLGPVDRNTLKEVAKNVLKNKNQIDEVVVTGHASKPGTEPFNMELSEDRAENVKRFLVEQGVSPEMIKVDALGEQEPLSTNEKSRRVEIVLAQN